MDYHRQEIGDAVAEPIAIVGVGCHLPGNISSVEELVVALRDGRDCITEVPPDRWDVGAYYDPDALKPGKTYVRHGGFVNDIDRFDAAFFGIADAEASRMDPQQRMALQTVWHALENAGQSAEELIGSKTGVFLAMMNTNDYSQLKGAIEGIDGIMAYDAMGDAMSITAGRISYFLGLEGPCVALDAACSGSMVAVHLARRSILARECDSAIVVGVSAILHPGIHIAFSKLGLMSRAGRCAAFDEQADGYIRGEGCIAVLLRRQSLALSRRDHILASIGGTAINQNGRTPAITAPNGASQEKVIRKALQRAGLNPNDIGYLEAHGTGTRVGDPIEMRALVNVFGADRSDREPLFVGSVKSNFGHLEAGAGLLGMVKAALSLDEELIFPSLHFHRLNTNIHMSGAPIRVAATTIAWPRGGRRRIAGVNSFGYSGTNAHVVLQEAGLNGNGDRPAALPHQLVALSAKSAESLQQLVNRWMEFLAEESPTPLADIAFTAATGRTHLRHRLAVIGSDKSEIREKLRSWREGHPPGGLVAGQTSGRRQLKTAFVFSGEGAQYEQMGRQLYELEPRFRAAINRVAAQLDSKLGVPLREVLFGSSSAELLEEPRYARPALFAIEYALADLLGHLGIEPDYVIGPGVGEIAAASAAGALDLDDAVKLVVAHDASVRISQYKLPVVSSITGDVLSGDVPPEYWSAPAQQPVLFHKGIGTIIDAGCKLLIEIGPEPALGPAITAAFETSKTSHVATLQRDGQDVANILGTFAALYAAGAPIRLDRLFHSADYQRLSLPLYPFRRERHWLYGELSADGKAELHPVLTHPVSVGSPDAIFEPTSPPVDEAGKESELTPDTAYLYEVQWQPKELGGKDEAPQGSGRWLILADSAGVGQAVASLLEARGEGCTIVAPAEVSQAECQHLLQEAFGHLAPRGVIHFWSLNAAPLASLLHAQDLGCGSVLNLVQALVQMGWSRAPRLWLVTRHAQAAGSHPAPVDPTQAPMWGLGKVIAIEHPELRCTKVDLSADDTADIEALFRELTSDDLEDQIALRSGLRYVARLVRREQESIPEAASLDQPYRLEITTPGILDHLTRRLTGREVPGPGQVEIKVSAVGLNFSDVMKAMGIYPGLPDGPVPLGSECSGTIVAVGPGVEGLAVGDGVVAVAPLSFGSFVTAAAPLVALKPPQLSFEEAATIPLAFLTAFYALRHLGQLSEGDRVLIHAASGGVGLAAVQIAQQAGAEIFATAGSPEKRAYLKTLGVRHVMDSRSLEFADEVLARTNGRGVDVVLNSLAGDGMLKSLEVLAPFGRFLEIGKRDIYENRAMGLAPFQKHLAFFSIDLERLFAERPSLGVKLFREVLQAFENGTFTPLRLRVFPIPEVVSAFREMAQAKHIGKIVVSLPAQQQADPALATGAAFHPESTYLITGGLGGLGLTVAQWMVAQGARHLVLMGRSEPSVAARERLAALQQAGALVTIVKADVAEREQVSGVLAEIDRSMPPLAGIIHAAGIQDDGVLLHLSRERFRTVMAPKVDGAWNLHTLTSDRKLDFFVLFSSAASLIGSPGQGNYAAANAFLDALAHYRRANGMPALSINWGAWSQVGLAARLDRDDRMAQLGMLSITPQRAVNVLGRLLSQSAAQVGVMRVQVRLWLELFPRAAGWPFLAYLTQEEAASGRIQPQASPIRNALMALPAGPHRRALLESHLQEEFARVLRVSPTQIGRNATLQSFDLDSLSAVELRNRCSEALGVFLSPTLLWDQPTIAALATHLAAKMEIPLDPAEAAQPVQDVEANVVVDSNKKSGIAIERSETIPLIPENWSHPHPYFRYVEPYKGFLLSRLRLDKRFVRGEGVWLFDQEGQRILDGIAQYGALPFGYNPPEIWQALQGIQDRSEPSFAANSLLDAAGALADRLIGLWPEARFENVVFTNSGAEAVEAAIKLCRAATGRQRLLSTRGAYHGLTLGALSATGSERYQQDFGPPTCDVDHLRYGDAEAVEKALLSHPGVYAAFLVEPIQGEAGIVEPPAGYLARVRRLCDQTGTLLLVDEVQTGLGRTGELFASQAEGVTPDVMVLAKALGGGLMPIGACLYTSKARSLRFGLHHSSTFAANALACRAGLAALDYLEKDGRALISAVKDNGVFLKSGLEDLERRFPALIAGITGRGYMLGIRLDFSNLWRIPGLLGYLGGENLLIHLIVSYLLNVEGVRLSPSFSSGNVLRLEPPLVATREHCQALLVSLARVLQIVDLGDAARLLAHLLGGIGKPAARPQRTSAVRRPPPEPRRLASGVSRFAFTVHLMSITDLTDLDPTLEQFEPAQLEQLKEQLAGYIVPVPVGVIELESKCGARAYGELILVPYTAAELAQMDPAKARDEVRLAVQVAQERGAQLVGLGGFTSIVTQGGLALNAKGLPPLTSGSAYTAVAARDAVLQACQDRGLRLEGATLAIVGAAGMIGRAAALLLADRVERLILVGNARYPERTGTRLREVGVAIVRRLWQLHQQGSKLGDGSLAARLLSTDPPRRTGADPDFAAWFDLAKRRGDIHITHDAEAELARADVLLAASSSVRAFIGARHLKPNAIVCDVARPFNVDPDIRTSRRDVTLIEGGLVRVGGRMEGGIHAGPRPNVVYACIAETMLWALEKTFDRVRLDSSMSMETIEELESYGRKHGFEIEIGAPV